MQQNDDVVAGWLSGSDGDDNPAGPLYIEGAASLEAALTNPSMKETVGMVTCRGTTCSYSGGCLCC